MSTRANIIIKDGNRSMIFYRHSDGYPEGTLPSLRKFIDSVKNGPLRNNLGQAAGNLIVIGAIEYGDGLPKYEKDEDGQGNVESIEFQGWKCGAYEPTDGIHGDIEHLYLIDLKRCTIEELEIPEGQNWKTSKVIELHHESKAVPAGWDKVD